MSGRSIIPSRPPKTPGYHPGFEDEWIAYLDQHLTVRARNIVLNARCHSLDDIRALGMVKFRDEPNCGKMTLDEIGQMIGGWYVKDKDSSLDGLFARVETEIEKEIERNPRDPRQQIAKFLSGLAKRLTKHR